MHEAKWNFFGGRAHCHADTVQVVVIVEEEILWARVFGDARFGVGISTDVGVTVEVVIGYV
jgi:hypothetical protein